MTVLGDAEGERLLGVSVCTKNFHSLKGITVLVAPNYISSKETSQNELTGKSLSKKCLLQIRADFGTV